MPKPAFSPRYPSRKRNRSTPRLPTRGKNVTNVVLAVDPNRTTDLNYARDYQALNWDGSYAASDEIRRERPMTLAGRIEWEQVELNAENGDILGLGVDSDNKTPLWVEIKNGTGRIQIRRGYDRTIIHNVVYGGDLMLGTVANTTYDPR